MDTQNAPFEDMVTDPNIIIERLGGTSKTAEICDLKPPSITQWRSDGIPKPWLKYLRLAYPAVFRQDWKPPEPAPQQH
jgi:hypothetical protein